MDDSSSATGAEKPSEHAELVDGEYPVILVHGTFAGPQDGVVQWYQPGSPFCQLLDRRLADAELPERCWVRYRMPIPYFHWGPGDNDWISRAEAAQQLRRYLGRFRGYPCHIVAHSHGGNVVLEALGWNSRRLRGEADWFSGTVTLLGTPIIERDSAPRNFWRPFYVTVIAAIGLGLLRIPGFNYLYVVVLLIALVLAVVIRVVFPFVLMGQGGRWRWLEQNYRPRDPDDDNGIPEVHPHPLLIINSEEDEVFWFLDKLLRAPNPFITRTSHSFARRVRTFLRTEWRNGIGSSSIALGSFNWFTIAVTTIFLGAVVYEAATGSLVAYWVLVAALPLYGLVAALTPNRPLGFRRAAGATLVIVSRSLQQLAALPVLAVLRRLSWPFIQAYALGLSGSRISVRSLRVEMNPWTVRASAFKTLPADFVAGVRKRRRTSVQDTVEPLFDTLRLNEWSIDTVTMCLRDLQRPDLVHTSYCSYLEDEWVIQEIVSHIEAFERDGDHLSYPYQLSRSL
jgi:hypothetical protein